MWQLWLFGVLFVLTALVIFFFEGWSEYMGNPDSAKPAPMLLAAAIFSGFVTLLAMGVASVFS